MEGDCSVEVEPRFYRVALGVLKLQVPLMDVLQEDGEDFFSLVFMDSEHLEFVTDFLLVHGMFTGFGPDPDVPGVNGSFHMHLMDGDLMPVYFLEVPEAAREALETCLMSHFPSPSGSSN